MPAMSPWPQHRIAFPLATATALARGDEKDDGYTLHPWIIAQLRARLRIGPGGGPLRVGIPQVRAKTTKALVDQLKKAGVAVDVEDFASSAEGFASAWDLAQTWEPSSQADEEFVGLAACELWRRSLADRPSLEMLDELMQDGYDALDAGDLKKACDAWLRFADALLTSLPKDAHTVDEADAVFPGVNSIGNWLGDVVTQLNDVAARDAELARTALPVVERLHRHFAADEPRAHDLDRALADLRKHAG